MEFGMAPYGALTEKDFLLQEKPQPFLPGKRSADPKLYIGLPQWTNKNIFRRGTKPADMLEIYAEEFRIIELNSSHYGIPTIEQIKKWKDKVPEGFLFCPKFPKSISHAKIKIDDVKKIETNKFFDSIHGFEDKLGPSFMQMIEYFDVKHGAELLDYLAWIPREENVFIDVRHESWFKREEVQTRFFERLNVIDRGWVITDTPGRRDAVHLQLPVPRTFIRFVCMGDEELDLFRIAEWKKLLTHWFAMGLKECVLFCMFTKLKRRNYFMTM